MSTQLNIFRFAKTVEDYAAGAKVFSAGDYGDVMYVVQEGEVEIYANDKLIETVGAGSVFGEMALLDQTFRMADAVAKTDVKVVPINRDQFIFMVGEVPNFALTIMRIMSERIRRQASR
jgi:CRP-like cAMP-binding protein